MRHGTKPTSQQKKVLSRNGLDPLAYLAVGSVGTGWLFRDREDESNLVVCYPDRNGVFKPDGKTPIGGSG